MRCFGVPVSVEIGRKVGRVLEVVKGTLDKEMFSVYYGRKWRISATSTLFSMSRAVAILTLSQLERNHSTREQGGWRSVLSNKGLVKQSSNLRKKVTILANATLSDNRLDAAGEVQWRAANVVDSKVDSSGDMSKEANVSNGERAPPLVATKDRMKQLPKQIASTGTSNVCQKGGRSLL